MKVITLAQTESTNTYAKIHFEDLDDCSVIHALRQTSGRGRFNRKWIDLGENNLFFSIVLKPEEKYISVLPNLTQYACVALCKILEKYDVSPKIKWPNDIMIDGKRKISGILSESVIVGGRLKGVILGIGVNLNAQVSDIKSITERVATGLNIEIGKSVNMNAFLNDFLDEFFSNYSVFLKNGFSFIKDDYIKRNCFLERDLKVQVLDRIKSGYAKELDENGELVLINTDDNEEVVLTIGDIL